MHRPVVLIVEDEALIMLALADSLDACGYEVLTAANGHDALRRLDLRQDIDLLFTDINLPGGMNGLALARLAREKRPGLPIIYASGRFAGIAVGEAVPGGRFLAKPYRPSMLVGEIETMLAPSQSSLCATGVAGAMSQVGGP